MDNSNSALSPYRVLDMTGEIGAFCTKVLAALGADVIRVESPGGDPTRRIGPFYHDEIDIEKSLYWFNYNLNKRSVTLNIEDNRGKAIFKKLVKKAHFLVESFTPGYLDKIGLGYSELSKINPALVHTSITPYGIEGPYSQYKGSNLTISAAGGFLNMCGDSDRPPAQIAVPVAYIETGLHAASATMIAHWYRQKTGEGQFIDVSGQESLMDQILPNSLYWRRDGLVTGRSIAGAVTPGKPVNVKVFKCKDGWIIGATTQDRSRVPLRQWMAEENMAGDLFDKKYDHLYVNIEPPRAEEKEHIDELFQAFVLNHTKDELMMEAQRRGAQVAKINTVMDVVENPQSRFTGYFVKVEHPELGEFITYAGAPLKSEGLDWSYHRRAPFVGEHNGEIYVSELGMNIQELAALKEQGTI